MLVADFDLLIAYPIRGREASFVSFLLLYVAFLRRCPRSAGRPKFERSFARARGVRAITVYDADTHPPSVIVIHKRGRETETTLETMVVVRARYGTRAPAVDWRHIGKDLKYALCQSAADLHNDHMMHPTINRSTEPASP